MKRLLRLAIFAAATLMAAPAAATTYYVSTSGSDANSGTSPAGAWRSVGRVSAHEFAPGDRILFEGGQIFSGNLYFDAADAGTPAVPVEVSSFGTGRATISAPDGHGILGYNTAGFYIHQLDVVGAGRDVNTGSGIFFYNDLPGDVLLDTIRIHSVDAARFGRYGVEIGSHNLRSGFRNVRITYTVASENGLGGIFTYAQERAVHRNVYVGYSSAFLNLGFSGLLYNSGNGITLSGVDGGTIEYSVAHSNGSRSTSDNGPVGIWTFLSNNVVIQHSESFSNKTGNTKDGGGFHLDNSTSNSVLQYNYSHDNSGAGYMLAHKWNDYLHTGNVVRWNISQNDARKNSYASIHLWGRIRNAQIYNNTVYLGSGNSAARALHARNNTIETQDLENVRVSNNQLQTTGGLALLDFTAAVLDGATGVRIEGNNYWSTGGTFRILWRGTTYSSLSAFRTATGQEQVNGAPVGLAVSPDLAAPGTGPSFNNAAMIRGLWQYRLKASSQLIDAGVDLSQLGINPGPSDFFGGSSRRHFGNDIGAHEYAQDCNWSVTPDRVTFPAAGGSATAAVWAAAADCGWAALPSAAWLTASPSSGAGEGTLSLRAAANAGVERSGTIRVADRTLTVSQAAGGAAPPPTGTIGSWSYGDIGSTGITGRSSGDGSTFTVEGGGADIWGSADAFHFVAQQVSGDWEIEARVASVEAVNAWTKVGLMVRATLDAGSPHASIFVTPAKGISVQYRAARSGTTVAVSAGTGTAPQWVRLARRGNTVTASVRNADGTWRTAASASVTLGTSVYVGLAVTSHDVSQLATGQFESVAMRPLDAAPPPPPPPPAELTWTQGDIGAAGPAGATATSGTSVTIEGAGADIWGTADAFHFSRAQVSGDWDIEATVSSVEGVHAWTKAGVMIRETLSAGSKHASLFVTPAKGISFQYRASTGGTSAAAVSLVGTAPQRIRLTRRGSTIAGYVQDSGGSWITAGTRSITMGSTVYIGLAVTSHDVAQLATAQFEGLATTPR